MYFTSSIADDIRVPLQINIVYLVLLKPRRRTPHRSCSNDGIVHHSGASNPMMLRSTRLCQRGCTLVASLCYSAFMSFPQGSFAMELLWYYYSCIWLEGVEQRKTGGFFPLVSLSKKKRRNFNIHLDVLFKLICMNNRTNCITGIIRFLFFFISMWFDFNLTTFLHSRVLPIHVNQTPGLTKILCFQMLSFSCAFLSYSCVFPVPTFIESSNSKEPLQIYFIFR